MLVTLLRRDITNPVGIYKQTSQTSLEFTGIQLNRNVVSFMRRVLPMNQKQRGRAVSIFMHNSHEARPTGRPDLYFKCHRTTTYFKDPSAWSNSILVPPIMDLRSPFVCKTLIWREPATWAMSWREPANQQRTTSARRRRSNANSTRTSMPREGEGGMLCPRHESTRRSAVGRCCEDRGGRYMLTCSTPPVLAVTNRPTLRDGCALRVPGQPP